MNENLPIKERMAVIFHGIVGGMGGRNGVGDSVNISDCAKTIKYNILSTYDNDIFAHTWSIDHADEIKSLYNPVATLFQPQEYFGFDGSRASDHPEKGQAFRIISRYTSFERAMQLKSEHERLNGFRYKWILALRYDLVFFTKLDLSKYDPSYMYICSEPHWGGHSSLIHDIVFLSSSNIMDAYCTLGTDMKNGTYDAMDAHRAEYNKLMAVLNNNGNLISHGFHRYKDVEIYRMVIHPETNPVGHAYGALETTGRFHKLMEEINNEGKF